VKKQKFVKECIESGVGTLMIRRGEKGIVDEGTLHLKRIEGNAGAKPWCAEGARGSILSEGRRR